MGAREDEVRAALRVGADVDLARIDPRSTPGVRKRAGVRAKDWSVEHVRRLGAAIGEQQERLYAGATTGGEVRRVLLVLQAMDCGGKDGTVRSVVGAMNPLGVRVVAFGPPTRTELSHPFLWRIERALPPSGYVGVFNRSHYEDVLVARVRGLAAPEVIEERYGAINAFEERLSAGGLTIIKVFLHISPREQAQRLLDRLDDPTKRWKFNPADLDDRDRWREYQEAYELALRRCTTGSAPWYVVPADRKWYRNWAVANLLLAHLEDLKLHYPEPALDLEALRQRIISKSTEGMTQANIR